MQTMNILFYGANEYEKSITYFLTVNNKPITATILICPHDTVPLDYQGLLKEACTYACVCYMQGER